MTIKTQKIAYFYHTEALSAAKKHYKITYSNEQQNSLSLLRSTVSSPWAQPQVQAFLAGLRVWMFERSEFPDPPPKAVAPAEILRPRGRFSLVTFFGDAKKVTGRAAVKRNRKKSEKQQKSFGHIKNNTSNCLLKNKIVLWCAEINNPKSHQLYSP